MFNPLFKLEKQEGQFSSIVSVPVGILICFLSEFSQLLMVHLTVLFHFHFFIFGVTGVQLTLLASLTF